MILKDELINRYDYSSRLIREIKRNGQMQVNGENCWVNRQLKKGDQIEITMPEEKLDGIPTASEFAIVYEDEEILIINKSSYCITHPTGNHQDNTLANYISYHWQENDVQAKVRFINRLDRDTTGLIAVAKNKYVHHYVQKQMSDRRTLKRYLAFVYGKPQKKQGVIRAPIDLLNEDSFIRVVSETGQEAETHYRLVAECENACLMELELKTGRTHQIRVHMHHLGIPIIGDPLYSTEASKDYSDKLGMSHQALHASELKIKLPLRGDFHFKAEMHQNMLELQRKLLNKDEEVRNER
ncbi:RluA family pseudouridine synthase [Eubacteriaceae bacterium ES3]|nr:RluA family pseudouridine synthase [Eubacteriaceae bacterium ES3]